MNLKCLSCGRHITSHQKATATNGGRLVHDTCQPERRRLIGLYLGRLANAGAGSPEPIASAPAVGGKR